MQISSHNPAYPYRKDIDGLRAIAVLSVILFHLNSTWMSGGFIGVDLFFVISGYLITGLIRKDIENHEFSIKGFYLRRIRRIAPALLVMLITASCAAWLILKPEDIISFAYSLVAQFLSLQNFVFLSEGHYFIANNTKALLHTWSLAVEEQFYLFWPMLLVLLARLPFKALFGVVTTIIVASFYLNTAITASNPDAAFYLIFTRAWEFGLGGLAALWHENQQSAVNHRQIKLRHWIYETLGWVGISGLGYAIFEINSSMPFPGKIALIPTLAAFFIVLSGSATQTTASKILSLPLLVKIGLISYPLYLWHWPMLVFMRYLNIKPTNTFPLIIFWIATFTLAYASYRWLEIPIRRRVWLTSPRSLLTGVVISFVALAAFATHVLITDGASYRFNGKERVFLVARIQSYTKRCDITARILDPTSSICKLHQEDGDQRKILLWGDSHASMLVPMLKKLANQNRTSLYINVRNCPPFVAPGGCNANIIQSIINKIQEKSINNIIFAYAWGHDTPDAERSFVKTIRTISQQGVNIWLMVDIPTGDALDPQTAIKRNPDDPHAGSISLAAYNEGCRFKQLAFFQRLKAQFPKIRIIDTSPAFCDQTKCWSGKGNEVWYRDSGHLNDAGGLIISSYFLPAFH